MAYVGIDLGTTHCLIAIKKRGKESRVLDIGKVPENTARAEPRKYFPSAVGFKDGEFLAGWDVVDNPKVSERILAVKKLIGRDFDDVDPTTKSLIREWIKETWGYSLRKPLEGTGEDIEISIGKDWMTPQEISAIILRKLIQLFEKEEKEKISGAVITVPSYFNEKQKRATIEAANLAGLSVQMVLDEPIAAAIACGMGRLGGEPQTILVYDLGGGTFDVSLLEIEGASIEAQATRGNNWLGRGVFDGAIETDFLNIIKTPYDDVLIYDTLDLVDSVMQEESVTEEDIDRVLLVGGSTRIPLVRELLADRFGEEKIVSGPDPMFAVATGAAIKSNWLLNKWQCPFCLGIYTGYERFCPNKQCGKPRPKTGSCTEQPYGVFKFDQEQGDFVFDVLIPKYRPYPLKTQNKRVYTMSNQEALVLKVPVYAGKKTNGHAYHPDPEKNIRLGSLWILLPESISEKDEVEIQFGIGIDGTLDLDGIAVSIRGESARLTAIGPDSEEERIAIDLLGLMKTIHMKIDDPAMRIKYLDSAYEILDDFFTHIQSLRKKESAYKFEAIDPRINEIKTEITIIRDAKILISYSYFVGAKYGWLPFMKDESRRAKINEARQKLIEAVEDERLQTEENTIQNMIVRLTELLKDETFDFIISIIIAEGYARNNALARVPKEFESYLKDVTETGASQSKADIKRVDDDKRKRDEKTISMAREEIESLLRKGEVEEASREYRKIQPLVSKYLAEANRRRGYC